MESEKIAVEVEPRRLLEWANNKPQWQTILSSESYQNEAKEAWEWLQKNSNLKLELEKEPFMTEEQFYEILKNSLTVDFASELFDRCLAGVEDWQSTTVDEQWLKAKMHRERKAAAKAINRVMAKRRKSHIFTTISPMEGEKSLNNP